MSNIERFALNLGTVGQQFGFTQTLDAARKYGFPIVSPWRHHYQQIGTAAAAREVRARGMTIDTICRMSGFGPAASPVQWGEALDEAKAIIEEAVALDARGIVFPGGGVGETGGSLEDARQRIADGLAEIMPLARQANVMMLVEPLHPVVAADRGAINTIGQALELCEAVGDGTGIMVDSYNVWWDPQLEASLVRAGALVCGYQVSDWLLTTRHTAFDRGMVGDGVIDFAHISRLVARSGYTGPIEIEVLSELDWAKRDLDEVLSIARDRMHQHLGGQHAAR